MEARCADQCLFIYDQRTVHSPYRAAQPVSSPPARCTISAPYRLISAATKCLKSGMTMG